MLTELYFKVENPVLIKTRKGTLSSTTELFRLISKAFSSDLSGVDQRI